MERRSASMGLGERLWVMEGRRMRGVKTGMGRGGGRWGMEAGVVLVVEGLWWAVIGRMFVCPCTVLRKAVGRL